MDFLLSNLSHLLQLFLVLCLILTTVYNWRRRWLYYYSTKFPGPFSLPVIGTVQVAFAGQKEIFTVFERLIRTCPKVWRIWIANQMCIVSSRPQDVEVVLNTSVNKEDFLLFDYNEECISSIFTSPVDVWKMHRKIINPSFNQQVINSFTGVFAKYAHVLTNKLEEHYESPIDILPIVWRQTLDTLFETLADVDPGILAKKNDDIIKMIVRYEQLLTERFFKIHLHLNTIWKLSSYGKETKSIIEKKFVHIRQLIDLHLSTHLSLESHDDPLRDKIFLNNLSKNLPSKDVESETLFMFIAGSETTAITLSSVLLILSIYPEIQEKLYEEQCAIFSDHTSDVTVEDVNRMEYLERVIKETMRLLPPAPYVARTPKKFIKLQDHTIPAGSAVIFPIWKIHKDPEYWPDPLKFDPDRFLPSEVAKRHRLAYLPFSWGPRNCIGLKYGMMSMKTMLSVIVRNLRVRPGKYKSIEDIEVEFHFVGKAKEGYQVAFEKRN